MEVIVGGANGAQGHPELGDQGQTEIPDFGKKSEVKLKKFSSVSNFAHGWMSGYWVYRCKNVQAASYMAELMRQACNNPNIGYNNGNRMDIFKYGVNADVPCGCDCSSLVGFCLASALGDTAVDWTYLSCMGGKMLGTGLFDSIGLVNGFTDANPPRTGDVLIASDQSHTEIIVSASGYSQGGTGGTDPNGFDTGNYNSNGTTVLGGFNPRTSYPKETDPVYEKYYKKKYCNNENTSYAWSRFSEILEKLCTLSRGPAEGWFIHNEDGYQRGVSPNIGAVMCFYNDAGSGGFVCIVENIGVNELLISMVSPITNSFESLKIKKTNGVWDVDLDKDGTAEYKFQGFIYNPNVKTGVTRESKLTSFIETAKQQIGNDDSFTKSQTGYDTSRPWSAAFIVAVAKKVGGLLDVIIPDTYSCSSIGSIGVSEDMGKWLNGPANGGHPYPQAGDIALFRYQLNDGATRYDANKAGIVTLVDPSRKGNNNNSVTFAYVVGDSNGRVQNKTATTDTSMFSGLFRPNWDKVDGLAGAAQQGYQVGGYYAQGTSSQDAAIIDYKYVSAYNSGTEPSINSTGLLLCAINHSGLLGSVYTVFANVLAQNSFISQSYNPALGESEFIMISPEIAADVAGLTGSIQMGNGVCYLNETVKAIYSFLRELFGGNAAGVIGFMANMWAESGFNTAAYNKGSGASGLCQWLGERRDGNVEKQKLGMIKYCAANGGDWRNNLTGQLNWLALELTGGGYRPTYTACTTVSMNLAGAKQACHTVLHDFERPGHYDVNDPIRAQYTERLWQLFFGGALSVE